MLVLSRKPQEKILIEDVRTGERIELLVIRYSKAGVRLGLEAPPQYRILRQELMDPEFTVNEIGEMNRILDLAKH